MIKNFIKVISNPTLLEPTVYLVPEIIKYDEKRTIIHIHVPSSAEVHSYKKVIYDRVDDADVKVTATGAIAQMYSKFYSGKNPEFVEGDIFRIIVPLDDEYSFDYEQINETKGINKMPINADKVPINADKVLANADKGGDNADEKLINQLSYQQKIIYQFISENRQVNSQQAGDLLNVKQRRARDILGEMVQMGVLDKQGAYKSTVYVLKCFD